MLSAGEECAPYGTKVRRVRANKKGEESDSDGIFEFGANFLVMRGRRGGRG